jgi:uncharacterized protein (DUF608 family)
MVCLEGNGALSHLSVKNRPDLFNEPMVFAALSVLGAPVLAKALVGPTPTWKLCGLPHSGRGHADKPYGLPHFAQAAFLPRFPFATVTLADEMMPLIVELCGWSPFVPGDADSASLPMAALEYRISNTVERPLDLVFSFHAINFMTSDPFAYRPTQAVRPIDGGFVLSDAGTDEQPWTQGAFAIAVDEPHAAVNCAWFRGAHHLQAVWDSIAEGRVIASDGHPDSGPSAGGSLYVPFTLLPGEARMLPLRLCWYCPHSDVRVPEDGPFMPKETYIPWYAGRFTDIADVNSYWRDHYTELRDRSQVFADSLFATTLPDEVVEAVTANLSILKSPTVLRQTDGRFYAFEGTDDTRGSCPGTCNHVWNYAQALPHLFPVLERGIRSVEAFIDQDASGQQRSRTPLPISAAAQRRPLDCVDGQLGHVTKVYRDWRISGDTAWLRSLWPRVRQCIDYCIRTWDPHRQGYLIGQQQTTYDNSLWGPNSMCTSFYLAALWAAVHMGHALEDDVADYEDLLHAGRSFLESELYTGEYFIQRIAWRGIIPSPVDEKRRTQNAYRPEGLELLEREGPIYQFGVGCCADGLIGAWMAFVCGLPPMLDQEKVAQHYRSVFRHNFFTDLSMHANLARGGFACGQDAGLVLCTWPHGGALSQPSNYAGEVWTGIEYAVAAQLMQLGYVDDGLEIVRAVRRRHDGRVRNPFDEYEAGHWYARALSSFALLQAMTGARYDAVERTLYLAPRISGDFTAFLSTATGFGLVGVREGEPFLEVKAGTIPVERFAYQPSCCCP